MLNITGKDISNFLQFLTFALPVIIFLLCITNLKCYYYVTNALFAGDDAKYVTFDEFKKMISDHSQEKDFYYKNTYFEVEFIDDKDEEKIKKKYRFHFKTFDDWKQYQDFLGEYYEEKKKEEEEEFQEDLRKLKGE